MSKEYEERVTSRLDAILTVMLFADIRAAPLITKVKLLKNAGLDYKEIARIVGTTPNSVSVMFAKLNKQQNG